VSALGDDRSRVVADQLWGLVRTLAARTAALEEAAAAGELDEDGRARLDRLRLKCARAAARAGLADELSDRVAEVRSRREWAART
jgi:hypothetical protein